jgi:hypothetical protein
VHPAIKRRYFFGFFCDSPFSLTGVKRVRRARGSPATNRPWTEAERRVVLD